MLHVLLPVVGVIERGCSKSAGGDGVRSGQVDAASSSAKNSLTGDGASSGAVLTFG